MCISWLEPPSPWEHQDNQAEIRQGWDCQAKEPGLYPPAARYMFKPKHVETGLRAEVFTEHYQRSGFSVVLS